MGKEKENISNPGQRRDYPSAALYLANSYGNMLKEKAYIDKVLSGGLVYTEDMAFQELTSISASAAGDTGVRVQTSNISNQPERIVILLDEGFVEKRNRELFGEVVKDAEGRMYLAWKIDVVETAMQERMDALERAIFKRLFVKHMTYKQIREAYHKKVLYDKEINKRRRTALLMIEKELQLRDGAFEDWKDFTDKLMQEAREDEAYGDNG